MNKLPLGIMISLIISSTTVFAEVSPETVVNIFNRIEALESKTRQLHGENEVLKHQLAQFKKVQKQGFLNIDERIDALKITAKTVTKPAEVKAEKKPEEQPRVKIVDKKPAQTTSTVAEEKKPAPITKQPELQKPAQAEVAITDKKTEKTTKPANKKNRAPNSYEKETYQSAFSLMKKSPTAASRAFQEYIKMQPESPLAANAQYWIGEIMYSHNNYKGAVQEFIKVLQKYKYSDKAPDAAIKLGYSFYALKNWAYAKRTFDDVIKYFPENQNAVKLAKNRLAKIKAAGH